MNELPKVLEHAMNPKNVGKLDESDPYVGTGLVGTSSCGDTMRIQIRVTPDGVIEEARFTPVGCTSAIASSSIATEWLKGKSLEQAGRLRNEDLARELALPPAKIACTAMVEDAVKSAVADARRKAALRSAPEPPKESGHA